MPPKAPKKRTKRDALNERIAEYLDGRAGATQVEPETGHVTARVYDSKVSGLPSCEHCGTVTAALNPPTPDEAARCRCVCHRAAEVAARARKVKPEQERRRPTPPKVLHTWPSTGAAAQYAAHPMAMLGRAAAEAAMEQARQAA